MGRLIARVLVLLCAAFPAAAQDRALPAPDEPAFPGQSECHVALPGDRWTPQEHWAWDRICRNEKADLSAYSDPTAGIETFTCFLDPGESRPAHSVLSPRFLRLILGHPHYRRLIPVDGVRIGCATFKQGLDLRDFVLDRPLDLDRAVFEQGLNLSRLRTASFVFMNAGHFEGFVHAGGIEVAGSLDMASGVFENGIHLTHARIGGDIQTFGSTFGGSFNAPGLQVGENLNLFSSGTAQSVKTRFEKKVNLLNAEIGGDLIARGSTFEGAFEADGLSVGGNAFLRRGASFKKDVGLVGATIGGNLDISGARFAGHLDFTAARVGDDLLLASPTDEPPEWVDGAALTLRNARVGALQDTQEAWGLPEGNLDLNGFTYDRIGGLRTDAGKTLADRPVGWLHEKWLGKQRNRTETYQPQPYRQLAEALTASGHADKADRILVAMRDYQRCHTQTSALDTAALTASWLLLGYGYRPWRALGWFAVLVGVGTWVVTKAPVARRSGLVNCFFFSLESAVPLVVLTPQNQQFALHLDKWVDFYFHIHKILGLILASVLVAGLTGLVS
jgi:hypothetical protein